MDDLFSLLLSYLIDFEKIGQCLKKRGDKKGVKTNYGI